MVRFRALQEKSAARRRFRRRRDRREPPERPSPNPLDASLRAPSASRVPVSRRSPTAVDAPRVLATRVSPPRSTPRHVRPLPPSAPSSALIRAPPPPSQRRRRGCPLTPARLSTCTFLLHWRVTSVN